MRRSCYAMAMGLSWLVGRNVTFLSATCLLVGCPSHPAAEPVSPTPHASAGSRELTPSASAAMSSAPVGSSVAPAPPSSSAAVLESKICGGIAGFRCAAGQYCAFPLSAHCGAGDMAGVCKPVADMCTMEFAPVCGCDGRTYASACVAGRSSVSVAENGACPGASAAPLADGALCGTRGVSAQCARGSYCAYKSQCGSTDAGGTCSKKPELCPNVFVGVCGCDGKTYPNACHAQRAGVNVAAPGACPGK